MKKLVARNFIIYSLPNIISKLIPFITLPITTSYLNLNDFGNIAIFELCLIPFQILLGFGPAYVINSMWFKLNVKERGVLLLSLILTGLALVIICILILSTFASSIFQLIAGQNWVNIKQLLPFLFLAAIGIIPINIFDSWVLIEKKASLSTIVKVSQIILSSTTIVIIAKFTQNYKYVIIGNVLVGLLISTIQFHFLYKVLCFSIEKKWFKLIYRICSPIFLRSIFTVLRSQFDRILVSKIYGSDQYALYNFSGKISGAISELSDNYQNAYDPIIYKGLSNKNLDSNNLRSILFFGSYLIIFLGTLFILFGQYFIGILTHNIFSNAYDLVVLYTCTIIVTLPFMANAQVVIFFQKTKFLFLITVFQTIIIICLALILVPKYGALGGILSFWIGTLFYMLMYFFKKRQLFNESFIEKTVLIYVILYHLTVIMHFSKLYILVKVMLAIIMLSMSINLYLMNQISIKNFIIKIKNK